MAKAFAMIMAGGGSPGLSVLTEVRAESAVGFAGKYRLIDFPLSNCVNSDIYNVAVLTQYRPQTLNTHIGTGTPWDLDLNTGGVRVLQPYRGGPYGDWQKGTADAVRRNLDFVTAQSEDNVCIMAGDHIYLMDYRPLIKQHVDSGADLTLCVRRVSPHETHRYGIVSMATDNTVTSFEEKPKRSRSNLASMGIYVFKKQYLIELLTKHAELIDFGRDVLPFVMRSRRKVCGHFFPGYWADVGNIQAYWEAHMSLLTEDPALDLYDPYWVVHTRSTDRAPVRIGLKAKVEESILANGAQVDGEVYHSVLSPGVYVGEGAVVRNSVILNDVRIAPGSVVDRCIIDKGAEIGSQVQLGSGDDSIPNQELMQFMNTGITVVGRGCIIPSNTVVGRNVIIHPGVGQPGAPDCEAVVESGASVGEAVR